VMKGIPNPVNLFRAERRGAAWSGTSG